MPVRLLRSPVLASLFTSVAILALSGCNRGPDSTRLEFQMGERIVVGSLTYNVIETVWRSQLGNEFKMRIPDRRYLLITVSVTNGGGHDISVPLLQLQGQNGTLYTELDNGEGVDQWFGLLRTLNPAQTQQGRLLFDVPLSAYRLKLTDGGDPGVEKSVWVTIPLRMDPETTASPLPEPSSGK
jgi:hypothetical protein